MKTTLQEFYPDIWQEIFEYFNPIELYHSFAHVTMSADEVLFNKKQNLRLRRLVLNSCVNNLSIEILYNRIISLELHEESYLHSIDEFTEIRELKLVGQSEWIIHLVRKVACINKNLERLILVIPGIGPLYDLLECVSHFLSLRSLEIYANEMEEKIRRRTLCVKQATIEYVKLHSCSCISWVDLPYMLPVLCNIHSLDITLFDDYRNAFSSFTFEKVRYIRLTLIEVPFHWIVELMKAMPFLVKLKLRGFVDTVGFVVNQKWLSLFELCRNLEAIIVNLSLEVDDNSFYFDKIQTTLRKLNLRLKCTDDDYDYYLGEIQQSRWWNLSGTIRYHGDDHI